MRVSRWRSAVYRSRFSICFGAFQSGVLKPSPARDLGGSGTKIPASMAASANALRTLSTAAASCDRTIASSKLLRASRCLAVQAAGHSVKRIWAALCDAVTLCATLPALPSYVRTGGESWPGIRDLT
jgi:hypothetical protein